MLWPFGRKSVNQNESIDAQISEAVREAVDLFREEDYKWLALGTSLGDLSETERQQYVLKSRIFGRRDALGTHIIRLWQNYGLGTGITYGADDAYVNTTVGRLWNDPKNQIVFSPRGQREVVRTILTDGEIFLAVFPGSPSRWRIIDSTEITGIATDPEDAYTERYYKRMNATATKIYRSVGNESAAPGVWETSLPVEIGDVFRDALVLHVSLDSMKGRGYPLLLASLEWILSHRQFMRSRIAIQQELARIARKVKIKGGPTAVSAELARIAAQRAARRATTDTPTMAGTRVENEGAAMESMDMETGAQAAQTDGAMILQLAGIGSSVFTHYLGAGEAFRLATATAMEAPMMISFMAFQEVIRAIYSSMLDFELRAVKKKTDEKPLYTLELPDVFTMDVPNIVNTAATLSSTIPGLNESEEFQKTTLMRAGYRNADKILEQIKDYEPPAPTTVPSSPPDSSSSKQQPNVNGKDTSNPEEDYPGGSPIKPSEANNIVLQLFERIARAREAQELDLHNDSCEH